ncbi:MAG: transporter substrate-binding domain-containing protein, partial [Ruthenibacterium sp.]
MKKSVTVFLLTGALALCFGACDGDRGQSGMMQDDDAAQSTSEAAASDSEAQYEDAKDGDPAEHTVEAIQGRGTLMVAIVENNPPYAFCNDDGTKREGLDNAMANTLAEDLGVALELIPCTQAGVVNAVRSGAADVGLGALLAGDKLLDSVQPTNAYAGDTQALLMCVEDAKSYGSNPAAFATKTIACLRDVPQQSDIVKELLPADCAIKQVRDVESGMKRLRNGTCAALMLDEFQAIACANDNSDLALSQVPVKTEIVCDSVVMAVMRDNESLLTFLNTEILDKYKKTGGLGRLRLSAWEKANNRGLLDAAPDDTQQADDTETEKG